jgi:formamidopyrimidine-DNA glycosylase
LTPVLDDGGSTMEERDSIVEWNAKGKFIYIVLNDGKHKLMPQQQEDGGSDDDDDFKRSIWVTLGMSGRFVAESQQPHQTTQARWAIHLRNGNSETTSKIFYHDPRNFGTLKFCLSAKALEDKLKTLGPDILQNSTTTEDVFVALVAAQKPALNVCKFLMNQKVRS